jgi:hypothetical protein
MSEINKDISNEVLQATASADPVMRSKAITQFLTALQIPVRQGVFDGDNVAGIFSVENLPPGVSPEIPTDVIAPGTEGDYRAFTNPGKGYIPAVMGNGDKFTLSTISNAKAVEWDIEYARNARWDVVGRYVEALIAGFVKKRNDDCWHTLLAAVQDRGLTSYDAGAGTGQFTKKLFSTARCAMARNSGGNQSSLKKGRMTDIYLSCEGIEEILNWNLNQIPDSVRAQLYSMSGGDNTTLDILKVRLHEMYELGVNQEYQNYYINTLGGALVPVIGSTHVEADVELAIALDLVNRDSFVMLVTQLLELFNDGAEGSVLHRSQKGGVYGWERYGVGVLDSRRVMALSY